MKLTPIENIIKGSIPALSDRALEEVRNVVNTEFYKRFNPKVK